MSIKHYAESDSGVEWATPGRIWRPLAESLNGFDLDPASGAEDTPIATETITKTENGLAQEWYGDVWVNPPYSKEQNPKWAKKVAYESTRDDVRTITALVPAATDTSWFQENYAHADYLTFIEGRIKFNGSDEPATFANVLCSYGEFGSAYLEALDTLGFVTRPESDSGQSRGWF